MDINTKQFEKPVPIEPAIEKKDGSAKEVARESVQEKKTEDNQSANPIKPIKLVQDDIVSPIRPSTIKEIENILSEDLGDFYQRLTPDQQQIFKKNGEVAANKISKALTSTKVKIKEIISIIRSWLISVPGLNKFFIEQSAKIKADKIVLNKDKF